MKDKYPTFSPEIEMVFQIIKENGGFDQCVADLYAILGLSFTEGDYNRWLFIQQNITLGDKVIVTDVSFKNQPYVFSFDNFYEYLGQTTGHYILRKGANYEAMIYRKEDYILEKCPEAINKNLLKPGDRCIVVYEVGGKNKSWSGTYTFVAETPAAFIVKSNSDSKEITVNKSDNWLEKY